MRNDWIRGKTVVVSGAGNGLGKYLAYNLISMYSCRVIGVDVDEVSLSNLKTKLNAVGEDFDYFAFDAKQEINWTKFASVLEEEKIDVDILINCVGQSPKFNNFHKYSHKETTATMSTNLYSSIFAIKSLYSNIKKSRHPAIINLCCATASMGVSGTSIYSASKSALKCYTEVLQQELSDCYVGLFILGLIQTNFWDEQEDVLKEKLSLRAMSPQTASQKIINCINKKKKRATIGLDAKISDRLVRLMPYRGRKIINKYLSKRHYRTLENK